MHLETFCIHIFRHIFLVINETSGGAHGQRGA